jgi:hypothetical protein
MVIKVRGLILRDGIWWYRRRVPDRLRKILNLTEVRRSLKTRALDVAQMKWSSVHADVERMFAQASRQPAPTPAALGYLAVQQHRDLGPRGEEALDLHLTTLLDRGVGPDGRPLKADERVILEALLNRQSAEQSPPLSVVFNRYEVAYGVRRCTGAVHEGHWR